MTRLDWTVVLLGLDMASDALTPPNNNEEREALECVREAIKVMEKHKVQS